MDVRSRVLSRATSRNQGTPTRWVVDGTGTMRRHVRRTAAALAVLFAASLPSSGSPPVALASHTVPLTVSIVTVDGVGDDLDGIGRSDGDFYAGGSIAGGPLD